MELLENDIPVVIADSVNKPVEGNPFQGDVTEKYGILRNYHNSLPVRIRVIDRMGVSTIIPPSILKGINGEFHICESRLIPRDVKFDSNYLLNSTATEFPERKLLAEEKEREFSPLRKHKDATLIYKFTMRRLMAYGGVIYHPETDTVIAVIDDSGKGLGENALIVHPHSHEGRIESSKRKFNKELESRKYNDFAFTIRIVDNIGSYGKRFTLINNQVYSVSPVRDTQSKEGIYVSRSYPVDGDYETKGMDEQFFPLSEDSDNQLGLYRSFHQALVTKERLISLELELKESKIQLSMQEQKFAEHKAKLQAEINELEALKNKRKEQNAINNEWRKESSEFLKHLPLIISSLGTIIIVSMKVAEAMSSSGGSGPKK